MAPLGRVRFDWHFGHITVSVLSITFFSLACSTLKQESTNSLTDVYDLMHKDYFDERISCSIGIVYLSIFLHAYTAPRLGAVNLIFSFLSH